jgi:hypothetical protein
MGMWDMQYAWGRGEIHANFCSENFMQRGLLIDGRMILKCIFVK